MPRPIHIGVGHEQRPISTEADVRVTPVCDDSASSLGVKASLGRAKTVWQIASILLGVRDMEQRQRDEWPAARLFHLSGGLRAFNAFEGRILIQTPNVEGTHLNFTSPDYYSAVDVLRNGLGRQVIGADFYTDAASYEGRSPADWKSLYSPGKHQSYCGSQADEWSFLAHAAFKRKDAALYDVSRRVSHQMRVCDWRLRQISEAYQDQLKYRTQRSFKGGVRLRDQLTWAGYLAIQSFLVDACVLRDYFAEYFARLRVSAGDLPAQGMPRAMAGLLHKYLGKADGSVPLVKLLQDATAAGGWLHMLGRYRDLVVHTAPLESAGRHLMAITELRIYGQNASLPSVRLPLPLDPDKLEQIRAKGEHLNDPDMEFARAGYTIQDAETHPDGLDYCHHSLCHLVYLSSQLLAQAPYKPEIPHLTIGEDGIAKDVNS